MTIFTQDLTTKAPPPTIRERARTIGQDIVAISAVIFLATTVTCWAEMKMAPHDTHAKTPIAVTSTAILNLQSLTPEACNTLKAIYEEAYVDALHPFKSNIDWDSLDKVFYTKYKECT